MKALLDWYRKHKRNLPWRDVKRPNGEPDTYRIFISEIMLQQTQVDRVIPKYNAWLRRFPSWRALSKAKTPDLLHTWAGLGYNRRALQVREAARFVVEHAEPEDEKGWRRLKGVGPYTAAALTEFANHKRAIVIDTNVRRVAGRIFFGVPYPGMDIDMRLHRVLERETPHRGAHWDLPQAFMDLGSSICTPRQPMCAACPMRKMCKAAPKFLKGPVIVARTAKTNETRHRDKKYPDRIYRGRILALVREREPFNVAKLGPLIDERYDHEHDLAWIRRMVGRLAKDGLLVLNPGDTLSLPNS